MMDHLRKQGNTALRLALLGGATMASISCGTDPTTLLGGGTILVAASTVGASSDPDGYTVSVNNDQAGDIGILDTVFVEDLVAGSYEVRLAGMAANCSTLPAENPVTVTVIRDDTVNAEFEITCDATGGGGGGGGDPIP
jgi:hypothetical protein